LIPAAERFYAWRVAYYSYRLATRLGADPRAAVASGLVHVLRRRLTVNSDMCGEDDDVKTFLDMLELKGGLGEAVRAALKGRDPLLAAIVSDAVSLAKLGG
jgi:hypothetical protein